MDLVGDVLKQADSAKLKVATEYLKGLSQDRKIAVAEKNFRKEIRPAALNRDELHGVRSSAKNQSRLSGSGAAVDLAADTSGKRRTKEAMRGLETVLATKMVESMMPKDQSRIYGDGTAGEIWRGMHIEIMGKALASQGLFSTSDDKPAGSDLSPLRIKNTKMIVPFAG